MEENEKILEDMETPWEEKLAKAKEEQAAKKAEKETVEVDLGDDDQEEQFAQLKKTGHSQVEVEESKEDNDMEVRQSMVRTKKQIKQMVNDKSIPHLTNLAEDPMLSGIQFYSLLKGEIHFGRKTGKPVPEIILGAIGIKPNHAYIKLLKNGMYELVVFDADAAGTTQVNGEYMNPKKLKRILNHCDRISFVGGIIFVFKYPKLRKALETMVAENAAKNEGIEQEVLRAQAWEVIKEAGIGEIDPENPSKATLGVHDYTEAEVLQDEQSTDWDLAYKEIEDGQIAKETKA